MSKEEMAKLSASEKEKTKLRERQRRAITTKIFAGLRKYGGYNLPPRADINDVLRALAAEAGWSVDADGNTYRNQGFQPQGHRHALQQNRPVAGPSNVGQVLTSSMPMQFQQGAPANLMQDNSMPMREQGVQPNYASLSGGNFGTASSVSGGFNIPSSSLSGHPLEASMAMLQASTGPMGAQFAAQLSQGSPQVMQMSGMQLSNGMLTGNLSGGPGPGGLDIGRDSSAAMILTSSAMDPSGGLYLGNGQQHPATHTGNDLHSSGMLMLQMSQPNMNHFQIQQNHPPPDQGQHSPPAKKPRGKALHTNGDSTG